MWGGLGRGSWFLYGRIVCVVEKEKLVCWFEERMEVEGIGGGGEGGGGVGGKMLEGVDGL